MKLVRSLVSSILLFFFSPHNFQQRTKTNIKIFSDPMPGSNERSVQLIGSTEQIVQCVHHFLDDISQVWGKVKDPPTKWNPRYDLSFLSLQKEPREPILLYEPGQNFMGGPPVDMGFPPPHRGRGRGGPPFRGRGRGRGVSFVN